MKRTIVLLSILLVILAGGGLGVLYLLKRGSQRQDLYSAAYRAYDDKDLAGAEAKLETILTADPGNPQAFRLLARILTERNRIGDLKKLCDEWAIRGRPARLGWRTLIDVLVSRGDFRAAELEALRRAPMDPLLVHQIRQQVLEMSADVRQRLQAVDASRRIADLSEDELIRAQALVRAAELLLEQRHIVPENLRPRLEKEAQSIFGEALLATAQAVRANKAWERSCKMLNARVFLYSDDPEEVAAARAMIRRWISNSPTRIDLRVALIRHLLEIEFAGKPDPEMQARVEADALGGEFGKDKKRASVGDRLRVIRWFSEFDRHDDAQALLERYFPGKQGDPRNELLSLEVLTRGDQAQRARAKELAAGILNREGTDLALTRAVIVRFQTAGLTEDALALLDIARERRDVRSLDLWMATLLARSDDERTEERAAGIAADLGRADLSINDSVATVAQLGGADPKLVRDYLDARIASDSKANSEHRLLRARLEFQDWIQANQTKAAAAVAATRDRLRNDLTAVLEDGDVPLRSLDVMAAMAAGTRQWTLLGRILGTAVSRRDALSILGVRLVAMIDGKELPDGAAGPLAAGMREGAQGAPAGELALVLAKLVEDPGRERARLDARLAEVEQSPDCAVGASVIRMHLAVRAGDVGGFEAAARNVLERVPGASGIRVQLGLSLMKRGATNEVMDLYAGVKTRGPADYALLVQCLLQLKRVDEARELALESIDKYPQDARAFLILSDIIALGPQLDGENDTAAAVRKAREMLRILSAAPRTRRVELKRAELYAREEVDRPDRAARILAALMSQSILDLEAQSDYAYLLMRSGRADDAIELCSLLLAPDADKAKLLAARFDGFVASPDHLEILGKILAKEPYGHRRARWLTLRALAYQSEGRVREALDDFIVVNDPSRDTGTLGTLNNGAWILMERARTQIKVGGTGEEALASAREWIGRAFKLLPEEPTSERAKNDSASVHDTAAQVFSLLGEHDKALASADEAIRLVPGKAEFYRSRATVLARAGKTEEALAQLDDVIRRFAGTQTEREALIQRDEIARESSSGAGAD